MDNERIKDARKSAKEIVNNAYKMNEFEQKWNNLPNRLKCLCYINYYSFSIQISVYQPKDSRDSFGKFKDLFLEEVEGFFTMIYKQEKFLSNYGHYDVHYRFLDLNIDFTFYPGENCKLEEIEVLTKKYKMNCRG